ncbi:MAG TPA: four helix bundle protein [Gemmatimonadales bacterium]|nr:four helix bundle protein [Gemmatimonadales bacterium]
MFSQVQRSSLSVQLNIAEGYALWYPRQRHRHLRIAYGSAVETVEVLELLRELKAVKAASIDELIATERRVCRMLVAWLKKVEPKVGR